MHLKLYILIYPISFYVLDVIFYILYYCCSLTKLCPTLWDPMNCSTPGFPVLRYLPELAQTHVHRVGEASQSSHLLSSPSPPAFNLSQYQGLFQWVSSSHQVAEVLEFHLQHQSFQWIFKVDFLNDSGIIILSCYIWILLFLAFIVIDSAPNEEPEAQRSHCSKFYPQ